MRAVVVGFIADDLKTAFDHVVNPRRRHRAVADILPAIDVLKDSTVIDVFTLEPGLQSPNRSTNELELKVRCYRKVSSTQKEEYDTGAADPLHFVALTNVCDRSA